MDLHRRKAALVEVGAADCLFGFVLAWRKPAAKPRSI
jgi:hypothetical protein